MNETLTMQITESNAAEYNDNYSVIDSNGDVVAMEHNKSEADKYVAVYRDYHGIKVTVRENSKDDVRAAQAIRPVVIRHKYRDDIIYGRDRRARFSNNPEWLKGKYGHQKP